ncbi:MAG: hypothetical protein B6245_02580 [Desulfobacteraceae bacterium 4572_88]|nr:MAG: hypothetical protein B6245_02580 [Desulfobacteraceae bacterium 4572_88]RLC21589.1 MAG: hypothetical protein DRI57_01940 [Deltaproteobacteria bacterium]
MIRDIASLFCRTNLQTPPSYEATPDFSNSISFTCFLHISSTIHCYCPGQIMVTTSAGSVSIDDGRKQSGKILTQLYLRRRRK